jgi:hypothetical protein
VPSPGLPEGARMSKADAKPAIHMRLAKSSEALQKRRKSWKRSWNVIENKGSRFFGTKRSWNVSDNKRDN